MKYTLKNLIEDCKNPELFRRDILKKLFSFEKELREKHKNCCLTQKRVIEEILGDATVRKKSDNEAVA